MATTLLPLLTSASGNYNPNIAETYSWIPTQNAERPLFAKAVFSTNSIGQGGYEYASGTTKTGSYIGLQAIAGSCSITSLTASDGTICAPGSVTVGVVYPLVFKSITVSGAFFLYKG